MVGAYTLPYVAEAIGMSAPRWPTGLPVTISFTVETDGRLPSGEPLGEAIEAVDAATDGAAAYFMVNCAHPIHFAAAARGRRRLAGADRRRPRATPRAKATPSSTKQTDLDAGDPEELGRLYGELRPALAQRPGARRLLRYRPPPHRRHLRELAGGGLAWELRVGGWRGGVGVASSRGTAPGGTDAAGASELRPGSC